jgi:hypothetical protein
MARRHDPVKSLDLFCTPPWAVRALCEQVLGPATCIGRSVWEPASGLGHMAVVLADYFEHVWASDVFAHQGAIVPPTAVGSFVGVGSEVAAWPGGGRPDWIITNPPFNLAAEFAERAIAEAAVGAALLTRTVWLEGGDRYRRVFEPSPPTGVALFSERVAMVQGRWDPKATTATSYAWVVWRRGEAGTTLKWIPPGSRVRLTRADDVPRFTGEQAGSAGKGNTAAAATANPA